jgi:hypothetical protein
MIRRKGASERGYFAGLSRKFIFLLKRGSLFQVRPLKIKGPGNIRKHSIPGTSFLIIAINSTFIYLLAYQLMNLFINFITLVTAYSFDIPAILYYNDILFVIKGSLWTPDSVKVVYSAGPVFALISGVLLFLLYSYVSEERGILKLLVLWMLSHSIVFLFGDIVMGSLFSKGFGYVLMYLYANDTVKMVISVLGITIMILLGLSLTKHYLASANTYFGELPSIYSQRFLFSQFLFPMIIGNIILYLVQIPNVSAYEVCVNATMFFLILPVVMKGSGMADQYYEDDGTGKIKIYFGFILASIVLTALVRIVLGYGIRI